MCFFQDQIVAFSRVKTFVKHLGTIRLAIGHQGLFMDMPKKMQNMNLKALLKSICRDSGGPLCKLAIDTQWLPQSDFQPFK